MGYDLQKKFFFLKIFFFLTAIIGCSDLFENPIPFPGHLDIQEEPKYDLDNDVVTNQDMSPKELERGNINTLFELEKQYQQDCYKTEYFFCPPSLFLDEIWEFQLITDTCKDPEEIVYKGTLRAKSLNVTQPIQNQKQLHAQYQSKQAEIFMDLKKSGAIKAFGNIPTVLPVVQKSAMVLIMIAMVK